MILKRTLILILLTLSTFALHAQRGTNSPYSYSGIGLLNHRAFYHQQFMGGTSRAFAHESSYSQANPASLAAIRYTTLELGASLDLITQSSADKEINSSNGKLGYFNMALPLLQYPGLAFSFGISPVSQVGYFQQNELLEDSVDVLNSFEGRGGINSFNVGLGYEVVKGLSVGVNVDALFGNIVDIRDKQYVDNLDLFNYSDRIDANYSGLKWNFGVQYSGQIFKKLEHGFGLTFSPSSSLNARVDRHVVSYNSEGNAGFRIDSILSETDVKYKLELPMGYGIAYRIGNPGKWMNSIEYAVDGFSDFSDIRGVSSYRDQEHIGFGGYFQPVDVAEMSRVRKLSDLLSVTRFYYGVSYTTSYLDLYAEPITEFGMGFGLGIPVIKKVRMADGQNLQVTSRLNLGINYKIRGTTDNGLIEERILELKAGMTLSDKWFNQRKYQ